ncbi:MAG: A/G-specific adenine glycosylase [Fimbriimonadales bacterium]
MTLLEWYDASRRDLPWRHTRDPYPIWVSEIMLQQTQVATVVPYYLRWMQEFPTVEALSGASEQKVLSLWQGLGYYRRCRMLLKGARMVAENGMPSSAKEWMTVPGVGRYTAGAIASIALGEPVPVVDGNVERVFARLTGCDESGGSLNRSAWRWAGNQVPIDRPGDWNQAVMELGATVCRPRDPQCSSCPLSCSCIAFKQECQNELPRATLKPKTVHLRREAWVCRCDVQFGLEQIPDGEWWEGMWRFPLGVREALRALELPRSGRLGVVNHTVTHHRITMDVHVVECPNPIAGLTWFSLEELKHLPMPAPQRRALKLAVNYGRPSTIDAQGRNAAMP